MDPVRTFETTSVFVAAVLFFLRPRSYVETAVLYDAGYSMAHDAGLRQKWAEGNYDPLTETHRQAVTRRAAEIRSGFRKAGVLVSFAILLAIVVRVLALGWPRVVPSIPNVLQVVGASVLLWATVWQVAWSVRSIGGETLSERIHSATVKSMVFLGTFLFVLAYLW
ncbi:MAG: hypothetical protein WCP28_19400 [Actinomycetes bacterium]